MPLFFKPEKRDHGRAHGGRRTGTGRLKVSLVPAELRGGRGRASTNGESILAFAKPKPNTRQAESERQQPVHIVAAPASRSVRAATNGPPPGLHHGRGWSPSTTYRKNNPVSRYRLKNYPSSLSEKLKDTQTDRTPTYTESSSKHSQPINDKAHTEPG